LIMVSNLLIGDMLGFDLVFSFSWISIVFAIVLGFVTLYLSAWGSAHKAAKISPITAIRNSEDIKINSKKVKSPKYIKKIFGVGGDISYKNLRRNKKKYRATVISIVVCVSIFIALASFIDLAFRSIQNEFDTTDYNISLSYRHDKISKFQDKAHSVLNLDNIEDYSIISNANIFLENNLVKFSKEYLKYYPDIQEYLDGEDEDGNPIKVMNNTYITVYRVGDHAYRAYLDELGLNYEDVKDKGILTYITSNKWMRAGYGKNLRRFLSKQNPVYLIDFAGQKVFESATVDVNILICKKEANKGQTLACTANNLCKNNLSVFVQQYSEKISFNSYDSWIILSSIEQKIQQKITKNGTPLKHWDICINFGIKTGLNDAFIIDTNKKNQLIDEDARSAEIIRPILRGRDIGRYACNYANLWLIATFPSKNYDINDFPAVKKYLLSFGKERLEQSGSTFNLNGEKVQSRKKTNNKWYETQDSISYWDDFSKQKIVWSRLTRISKSDFSSFPRFALVDEGYYVLDSLCFFTGDNLQNLIHLLNSEFAAYYFFNSVAILDNGGLQMRQQYVEEIPLPQLSNFLEGLSQKEIDNAIYEAFHFTQEEIEYIKNFLLRKKELIQNSR